MIKRLDTARGSLQRFEKVFDSIHHGTFADPVVAIVQIMMRRIGKLGTFLVLCGIYFGIPALLSVAEGTAFDADPNFLSYFDDVFGLVNYALTYPLLLMFLTGYYGSIQIALDYLGTQVISSEQVIQFSQSTRRLQNQFSRSWLLFTPLVVTVIALWWYQGQFKAIGALKVYGGGGQGYLTLLGVYWFVAVSGTLMFALVSVVFRHIIFVLSFDDFFHAFSLQLRPKNPDRCSGLAPVGNVTIQLTWVTTLIGIIVMSYVGLGASAGFGYRLLLIRVIGAASFYFLAAPIVLGYPVWIVHRAMRKERNIQLSRIGELIDRCVESISGINLTCYSSEEEIKRLSGLNTWYTLLDSHYSMIDKMPVWPIDFGSLRAATPILSFILSPLVTTVAKMLFRTP